MPRALPAEPPESSMLLELRRQGCFTDCYALEVPAPVTQAQFVEAFYTTPLFKAERFILRLLAARPSTDQDAKDLAAGTTDSFAVWKVAHRSPEQLLLKAQIGTTSSWLMAAPEPSSKGQKTTLYFGSAIAGRTNPETGKQQFSLAFSALLGLHDLYSRLLLQAAAKKLAAQWARQHG
jgi:hypothetical protein